MELINGLRIDTDRPMLGLFVVGLGHHELNTVALAGIVKLLLQERVQDDIATGIGTEDDTGTLSLRVSKQA